MESGGIWRVVSKTKSRFVLLLLRLLLHPSLSAAAPIGGDRALSATHPAATSEKTGFDSTDNDETRRDATPQHGPLENPSEDIYDIEIYPNIRLPPIDVGAE